MIRINNVLLKKLPKSDGASACKLCYYNNDGLCNFPDGIKVEQKTSCLWNGLYYYFKEIKLIEILSKL